MAKRPFVPLAVLAVITAASLGMIMMNPPSFDMEEGSFRPDNEMVRASTLISETFTSSASVMSLVDARGAGDIFTKDIFISVLDYEESLYNMRYTGAGGAEHSYSDLQMFMVYSPVSIIAGGILTAADAAAIADHMVANGIAVPTQYDCLRAAISILPNDAALKAAAKIILTHPDNAMAAALFTNDLDITNMTAGGCMISVVISDADIKLIQDKRLGFENDVLAVADTFTPTEGVKVKAVGMMKMMSEIGSLAQKDLSMLLPIAIAVIILLLLLIYRDGTDTFIGLFGLMIAVIWTFGFASLIGIGMSTIAIAVPILILALGIDYSLHTVFRYREERMSGKDSKEAMSTTLGSVGQALVLATVTTAIAFLSYQTSELGALADFGAMCAIGIVCAFGAMMLLIPSVQVMRDRKADRKGKEMGETKRYRRPENKNGDALSRISGAGGRMAAKSPWAVLGVMALIVAGMGYSATNLSYNFDMYDFIPEGTEAHETLTYLNENYTLTAGTTSVLIRADPWDIETIRAIEDSLNNIEDASIKGISYHGTGPPEAEYIGTVLKSLGERLTKADPMLGMMYAAPYGNVFDPVTGKLKAGATQAGIDALKSFIYVTLPSIDPSLPLLADAVLSQVVDKNGSPVTRMILHMTSDIESDNNAIIAMSAAVTEACSPLADAGIEYVTTGQYIIMASTVEEMNKSQMTALFMTIAFVILILTVVMYYAHKSLLLGTLATIPTIIAVIMVWGTMAALNIPLNVMTLTIASLAVGLGVTYGIHIANRYATELVRNDISAKEAIMITTRETGKGVFAAALTTVAGFGVMVFSKMLPMYQFGVITALAIGFGYLAAVFVLPSLLVIWGERSKPKIMERVSRGRAKNQ